MRNTPTGLFFFRPIYPRYARDVFQANPRKYCSKKKAAPASFARVHSLLCYTVCGFFGRCTSLALGAVNRRNMKQSVKQKPCARLTPRTGLIVLYCLRLLRSVYPRFARDVFQANPRKCCNKKAIPASKACVHGLVFYTVCGFFGRSSFLYSTCSMRSVASSSNMIQLLSIERADSVSAASTECAVRNASSDFALMIKYW